MIIFDTDKGGFSRERILESLKTLGVAAGDNIMVHSRLFTVGRPPAGADRDMFVNSLLDIFLEAIGREGTLIAPSFTLSFCKSGFFDLERSPSEMGVFSEAVRRHPLSRRTLNPIHSAVVIGRDRDYYLKACAGSSFGIGSIFDLLHKAGKVKFITFGIGNPCEVITHIHYVEQECAVPYRSKKVFSGIVRSAGAEARQEIEFFVRNPPEKVFFDHDKCFEVTNRSGIYKSMGFGNSVIWMVAEKDYYRAAREAICRDANVFAGFREEGIETHKQKR